MAILVHLRGGPADDVVDLVLSIDEKKELCERSKYVVPGPSQIVSDQPLYIVDHTYKPTGEYDSNGIEYFDYVG